jgi:hypothetical protein
VLEAAGARERAAELTAGLLDAYEMERLHASLRAVSAAHAREAGIAVGAEEAGLPELVGLLEAEHEAAGVDAALEITLLAE